MKRIKPESFRGPRAYFTGFDYRIISRTKNHTLLKKTIERKLKVLLLLKSNVVCAASHLASRFAYGFFKDNPELLSQGYIIPAFRSDKHQIEELFEKKRFKDKNGAARFFADNIITTVDWELEENSAWFRDRFVEEFENEKSVIRSHLEKYSKGIIQQILNEVRSEELLSRDQINRVSIDLPPVPRRILLNYRELIYHMSGARVVNCESSLPQENYIDYDLADIRQKRTKLSEEQILLKMLIEFVIESFQGHAFPVELLDMLSFQDILWIRQPLLESDFQEKYDKLIRSIIEETQKGRGGFLLNLNEIEKIRNDLSATFQKVFEEELPFYLKKRAFAHAKELSGISCSLGLGFLGFIPVVGSLASAASVLKDTPAFLFNLGQTYQSIRSLSDYNEYILAKEKILKDSICSSEINDKSSIIDVVELLTLAISRRMKF